MFKSIAVFFMVYLPLAVLLSFIPLPEAIAAYSLYAYAIIAAFAAILAGKTFYHDWQEEASPIQSFIFTFIGFAIVLLGIPAIFAAQGISQLGFDIFIELLRDIWQHKGDAAAMIRRDLHYLDESELLRLLLNAVVFLVVIQQSFSQTVRRQAR